MYAINPHDQLNCILQVFAQNLPYQCLSGILNYTHPIPLLVSIISLNLVYFFSLFFVLQQLSLLNIQYILPIYYIY